MSDLLFQRTSKRTSAGTLLVWLTDLSVTNRLTGWDGSLIVWSMDSSAMVEALAALGQPTRHDIYRLLARAPEGLPAGEIARHLNVAANTLSSHLGILSRAHLVSSRRAGKQVIYRADTAAASSISTYLNGLASVTP
ncbi:metalloregulator ArsR/SmtB family transcription factor [Sphingobium sp. WW5]|uniref:ArsR/SmtB family transcription factor n=1 Tax=Sphingobium TaxID=165695 RepID=UPI001912E73D|nr:metalloregulator ArsR/SmtB family transcription factor [Sphingobium yanoikuyae]